MTRTTELIAKGRFDVTIHEPRADEIGRLARAINHMTLHLSDFVKGQKRFLGDVAHELGSPIARIHFGLAALESRTQGENRERVAGIMEDMDHMSQLVNEPLAFSRAEMNKSAVKLEPIALLPAVEAAVKREASPQGRGFPKTSLTDSLNSFSVPNPPGTGIRGAWARAWPLSRPAETCKGSVSARNLDPEGFCVAITLGAGGLKIY
jgi:signal transduction histidine kinase